eukprot:2961062-Amphidinium_carterae.1
MLMFLLAEDALLGLHVFGTDILLMTRVSYCKRITVGSRLQTNSCNGTAVMQLLDVAAMSHWLGVASGN